MNRDEWLNVKKNLLEAIAQGEQDLGTFEKGVSNESEVSSLLRNFRIAEEQGFLKSPAAANLDSTVVGKSIEVCPSTISLDVVQDISDRNEVEHPERIGRFVVFERLGEGTFGTTYRARDPIAERFVAIKTQIADNADPREFIEEARMAADLTHSNIVTVFEVNSDERGKPYIAMELMSGGTLRERMDRAPMAWQEVVDIVAAIADALSYGHRKFVHRDLKPANILFDEHGVPKVADFGLALKFQTQHGIQDQVAGSIPYMSPEQLEDRKIDGRSDIWSLGVVFYEMLVGHRPFEGNRKSVIRQILNDEPRPIRQCRSDVPDEVAAICHECLLKASSQRPETGADIARRLRAAMTPKPKHAGRRHVLLAAIPIAIGTAWSVPMLVNLNSNKSHTGADAFDGGDAKRTTEVQPVFFPNNKESVFVERNGGRTLQVDVRGVSVLALGKHTQGALQVKIDIDVSKGDCGVFFGHHDTIESEGAEFQIVEFVRGKNGMSRLQRTLRWYASGRPGAPSVLLIKDSNLTCSNSATLQISIENESLIDVRVNDQHIDALVAPSPQINSFPGCGGKFGLFNQQGSALFSNLIVQEVSQTFRVVR